MTVRTISYQKVFPIAQFTNERIGMEASLDEKEDAKEAMERLKALVESCHVLKPSDYSSLEPRTHEVPMATNEGFIIGQPERTPEVPKTREGMIKEMIKGINNSTELKVLESYHLLTKNYPEIKEAYDKKLKQFQ